MFWRSLAALGLFEINRTLTTEGTGMAEGLTGRFGPAARLPRLRTLVVMVTLEHVEAVLRGWYPGWTAQLRGWSRDAIILWSVVACVFLGMAGRLHSK